jgi:hypothetical protein
MVMKVFLALARPPSAVGNVPSTKTMEMKMKMIEIIERNQKCELNTKAGYSARWIGKNGKPTGASFTTSQAAAVAKREFLQSLQ